MKTIRSILAAALAFALFLTLLPVGGLAGPHEHQWSEEGRVEPTCTEEGQIIYHCWCGLSKLVVIPVTGHQWGSWATVAEGTCTSYGIQARTCRVCGKYQEAASDKGGHSWGGWTVTAEPTDFATGTRKHTCKLCGTERSENFYPETARKRGDKGVGVKNLQRKLNGAGYDCGKVDGDFGGKTEAAVKALEEDHGFEPDGIAWPGVQKWLDGNVGEPVFPDAPELFDSYNCMIEVEEIDDADYRPGDEVPVKLVITNTGKKPLDIIYHFSFGRAVTPVSWDNDTLLENGNWRAVHEPGESSTLTVRLTVDQDDEDGGWVRRMLWFRMQAPASDRDKNEGAPAKLPADWPYERDVLFLFPTIKFSLRGSDDSSPASGDPME